MKNYIKIGLVLTIIYVSGAQAWFVRILNDTDGVINISVKNVWCKDDSVSIQPGKIGTVDTIACCYTAVSAEGTSGLIKGKKATYNPSNTCIHTYLFAQKDQNNNLILKEYISSIMDFSASWMEVEVKNMTDEQINIQVLEPQFPKFGSTTGYVQKQRDSTVMSGSTIALNPRPPCGSIIVFRASTGDIKGQKADVTIPCKASTIIIKKDQGKLIAVQTAN